MNKVTLFLLSALSFSFLPLHSHAQATLFTPTLQGQVPVKTWKALRDAQIVKQDLDYSCGAASLATILNGFYGKDISEEDILKAMNKEDGMASFADMAKVLPQYGFKGAGFALGIEQLRKLKVPVIVYLRYRGDDHFSVLRGMSEKSVWLGDPSWGNRIISLPQFLAMWETREDAGYKGKVLLMLPEQAAAATNPEFFAPPADNTLPLEVLMLRNF